MENKEMSRRCAANFNFGQMDQEVKMVKHEKKELRAERLTPVVAEESESGSELFVPEFRSVTARSFKKPSFYNLNLKTVNEKNFKNTRQCDVKVRVKFSQRANAPSGSGLPKYEPEGIKDSKKCGKWYPKRPGTPRPQFDPELSKMLIAGNGSPKIYAKSSGQMGVAKPKQSSGKSLSEIQKLLLGGEEGVGNVPKDDSADYKAIDPKKSLKKPMRLQTLKMNKAKEVERHIPKNFCLYNEGCNVDAVLAKKTPYRYYKSPSVIANAPGKERISTFNFNQIILKAAAGLYKESRASSKPDISPNQTKSLSAAELEAAKEKYLDGIPPFTEPLSKEKAAELLRRMRQEHEEDLKRNYAFP